MVRPRTLIVTGKTERECIDEMRVLELAEEQGIKKPKIRTCYLCKREEGENSLCLVEDNEDEVVLDPIELSPCEIRFGGGVTFSYLLCIECAVLLDVMENMEEDSEE
ncbi:hypothetical protein ACFLUU_04005 [Chloroflexota bacterium]